MIVSS
jgi:hypothetical protein